MEQQCSLIPDEDAIGEPELPDTPILKRKTESEERATPGESWSATAGPTALTPEQTVDTSVGCLGNNTEPEDTTYNMGFPNTMILET